MSILFIAAIAPVVALCFYIYSKDRNKEPKNLLTSVFVLGVISVIPVLICEVIFDFIFPMDANRGFIHIFISVFFGVALIEEFFKWLVIKLLAYNSKDFDEIFDIIVYSVFASLGFACIENVMYVYQYGFGNAIMRAVLAVPGHACFAVAMGYFLSKAKVAEISDNNILYRRNIAFSFIVPILLHTFYDALIFNASSTTYIGLFVELVPFFTFYISMVVICFITVNKTAKVQQNLTNNLNTGVIARNEQGVLYYKPVSTESNKVINYCPICGRRNRGGNFCAGCGFKLK